VFAADWAITLLGATDVRRWLEACLLTPVALVGGRFHPCGEDGGGTAALARMRRTARRPLYCLLVAATWGCVGSAPRGAALGQSGDAGRGFLKLLPRHLRWRATFC